MTGNDFLHTLQLDVENANEQEAFIFIHGFNVTFKDAARRTAQIAHDLNFQEAPIMYSWPSKGRPTEYVADRTTAHSSSRPDYAVAFSLPLNELSIKFFRLNDILSRSKINR